MPSFLLTDLLHPCSACLAVYDIIYGKLTAVRYIFWYAITHANSDKDHNDIPPSG